MERELNLLEARFDLWWTLTIHLAAAFDSFLNRMDPSTDLFSRLERVRMGLQLVIADMDDALGTEEFLKEHGLDEAFEPFDVPADIEAEATVQMLLDAMGPITPVSNELAAKIATRFVAEIAARNARARASGG